VASHPKDLGAALHQGIHCSRSQSWRRDSACPCSLMVAPSQYHPKNCNEVHEKFRDEVEKQILIQNYGLSLLR